MSDWRESEKIVLYVDGGCSGNHLQDLSLRRMVMVVTDENGVVLSEQEDVGGSNNIAELRAVRDALKWCKAQCQPVVEIRTDSRNNFSWVFGAKVGKDINDRAAVLATQADIAALRITIRHLKLVWVPRGVNKAGRYIEKTHAL